MKIISIIVFFIIGGVIFYFINKSKSHAELQSKNQNAEEPKDIYTDMRNLALNASAEQFELSVTDNEVYGVVMDWHMGDGIAILIAFETGDASLYLSTGGGVIGGGGHENVKKTVENYINSSQRYVLKASKTEETPLPKANSVQFYFLTKKGKFLAQESMNNFENNSSQWLPLFEEANKVITELRQVSDMK